MFSHSRDTHITQKKISVIEQTLKLQLQWLLFLRVVLYTLLLSVSFLFHDSKFEVIVLPSDYLIVFISFIYITTIGSAFYLNKLDANLRRFGFIQILLDTTAVSILVFFTGSSHSIFTTVYFFPIISGGLILPKKGGLVAAASATIQFGIILYLELLDVFPPVLAKYHFMFVHDPTAIINHFSVKGLTFFLAAILSALFATRLDTTEKELTDTQANYDKLNVLYKLIFDNISTGIITLDEKNHITSSNSAAEQITGYSSTELFNINIHNILPGLALMENANRQAINFTKQNGKAIRLGYSQADFFPDSNEIEKSLRPHKVLTIQDISKVEQLERKMRQSEKLAAIGMMSASIAHDFRNPLTAISGSAQVLSQDYVQRRDFSEQANYSLTEIIIRESKRLTDTITNFLRFARPELAHKELFSLKSCLDEVTQVLQASSDFPPYCKIILNYEDTLDVWADHKQLYIVLSELITNALAFCPKENEIIQIDAEEVILNEQASCIIISVSDNGPGFKSDEFEKVFEPFFTTRTDGTGLGLAIVRQTINEHKGKMEIYKSELGGAKFTLTLPLP